MKWIKLFEEYKQSDKVEAANVIFISFKLIKKFDEIGMKKVKDSHGDTFYWYYDKLWKAPYLSIVIDDSENLYVSSLFLAILNVEYIASPSPSHLSSLIALRNKALHLLLTSNSESLSKERIRIATPSQSEQFSKVRRKLSIKWNEKF